MNEMHSRAEPAARPVSDSVEHLLSAQLDAMFWRPALLGAPSAWYGHVPFAHWLVASARPRSIVELGTHAGVSYVAFCEAVHRAGLDTRCAAVDTWEGDAHAGFYGEEVFRDLAAFHDARYRSFSNLLRMSFDAALDAVPDGSVDLLHIDGRHGYDDVRHDFESWQPKLSARATVLLHDTNVRDRDFGVWRFWRELAAGLPHFEFLHESGLGVLAVGIDAPEPVRALCDITAPGAVARLRERFALLGERWMLDRTERRLEQANEGQRAHVRTLEDKFAEMAAYAQTLADARERPPERAELRSALARALAAEVAAARDAAALVRARSDLDQSRARLHEVLASRSWKLARRLRSASEALRPRADPFGVTPAPASPRPDPAAPPPAARRPGRVLFAAGEPDTPGAIYRCARQAEAARAAGWEARWKAAARVDADDLRDTDLVVLWRVTWSDHIQGVVEHVRMFGGRVALDLDDLMVRMDLARVEYIDAIRSINWSEAHVRGMFSAVMQVLHQVDFCIGTTDELAAEMRRWQKAAYVLPNCFDAAAFSRARMAARRRATGPDDGLVRIGYATGSRTHHRDFMECAEGVAAALRAREHARLVLFRSSEDGDVLLSPDEFPALADLADRIEWRTLVPLEALPDELARFDVNIVPLQPDNPFVDAKSELKYFEAALAGVPSVASPTGPYRRAIVDGETGLLAAGAPAWEAALLRLIDDAELRARMARGAAADVLWRHGPEGNAERMRRLLEQHRGGAQPAEGRALAEGFALQLAADAAPARLAPLTPLDTMFSHDALGEAAVTVVLASYNYADFIQQALESVRTQTLGPLDLVVVDDRSTDPATMEQILDWAHTHAARFNRLLVLRHRRNAGLGATRNTGFACAETRFVLPLDADNMLRPDCALHLLAALDGSDAAFAYPRLQHFGADDRISGGERYEPQRLVGGNYIDAMALIARWAWAAAGGYYVQRDAMGWEDFSLWCRLAELGHWGQAVDAVLAEYRVHAGSMVNTITETRDNKQAMVAFVEQRHPWLRILARDPFERKSRAAPA